MTYSKGGRGKKAPYQSKTIRVPEPLWDKVEELVTEFYSEKKSTDIKSVLEVPRKNLQELEALEIARGILTQNQKSKKSTKHCMEKLLQVIYNNPINL